MSGCFILGFLAHEFLVMAKGDGREVGFEDGGYISKFLK